MLWKWTAGSIDSASSVLPDVYWQDQLVVRVWPIWIPTLIVTVCWNKSGQGQTCRGKFSLTLDTHSYEYTSVQCHSETWHESDWHNTPTLYLYTVFIWWLTWNKSYHVLRPSVPESRNFQWGSNFSLSTFAQVFSLHCTPVKMFHVEVFLTFSDVLEVLIRRWRMQSSQFLSTW